MAGSWSAVLVRRSDKRAAAWVGAPMSLRNLFVRQLQLYIMNVGAQLRERIRIRAEISQQVGQIVRRECWQCIHASVGATCLLQVRVADWAHTPRPELRSVGTFPNRRFRCPKNFATSFAIA